MLARYHGAPIAAAICFRSADTLYGRYWGSVADFHSLHFETCYYQGIDYCIRDGLQKFEPGTQGEHKISRGFTPQATWSCHWLRGLASFTQPSATSFVARHGTSMRTWTELDEHVPYRDDADARARSRSATAEPRCARCAGCRARSADRLPTARRGADRAERPARRRRRPRRPSVCSRPIGAASFRGTRKASRSCGGAPIRARCCGPTALKVSRSLRRSLRNGGFEFRVDTAFDDVVAACAEPRRYARRHVDHAPRWPPPTCACTGSGWAHSFETWRDGELVGGLYGVAIGRVFFGESMFTRATDASKVALVHAVRVPCATRQFELIDCQVASAHTRALAPTNIPRAEFLRS